MRDNRTRKANALFGFVGSVVIFCIGIFAVLPKSPSLGIPVVLAAAIWIAWNTYRLFSVAGGGEEAAPVAEEVSELDEERALEARLRELEKLKVDGLIDEDEYRWKRREIVKEL